MRGKPVHDRFFVYGSNSATLIKSFLPPPPLVGEGKPLEVRAEQIVL